VTSGRDPQLVGSRSNASRPGSGVGPVRELNPNPPNPEIASRTVTVRHELGNRDRFRGGCVGPTSSERRKKATGFTFAGASYYAEEGD
jgi:hypothetical protein